MIAISKTHT